MARDFGYFSLRGDFEPDDISRQLGLNPTWSQRKGDIHPGSGRPRLNDEWCLACADDDFGDVGDQIISLVVKLTPKATTVAELSTKFDGTMHLVAYLNGNYPGFFLTASILRDLASLNVDLNCEYIYVSNEPSEDGKSAD
jgi:hypothetical protein